MKSPENGHGDLHEDLPATSVWYVRGKKEAARHGWCLGTAVVAGHLISITMDPEKVSDVRIVSESAQKVGIRSRAR